MGVSALVVAAGSGARLPGGVPKGLRAVGGPPLFLHSLQMFAAAPAIDDIVVVVPEAHVEECDAIVRASVERPVRVLAGGERRQDSVLKGLEALGDGSPGTGGAGRLIAVHDAARPFV